MFNRVGKCLTWFSSDIEVTSLYRAIIKLNNDVVAGGVKLTLDDIKNSPEIARQFVFDFINEKGSIYSHIIDLESKGDRVARHICALAINIKLKIDVGSSKNSNDCTIRIT